MTSKFLSFKNLMVLFLPKHRFQVHSIFCLQILRVQRKAEIRTKWPNAHLICNNLRSQNPRFWYSCWHPVRDFQLWDHDEQRYERGSSPLLPKSAKTFYEPMILTYVHDKQCILKNQKEGHNKYFWINVCFSGTLIRNVCTSSARTGARERNLMRRSIYLQFPP